MKSSTAICVFLLLTGCQHSAPKPLTTATNVDLRRFMGNWYVIANIPTFIEKDAHNAVESYSLNKDGSIATTFSFREGSFDGESKNYHPQGFVVDTQTNAVWAMQFVWPFKADYRIVWLSDDYKLTVIGRGRRDYVWIMARTPQIVEADYRRLLQVVGAQGYDINLIQRVPQQWN